MTTGNERNQVPEGVIIPPPDIRVAIEKTVGYTERNGQDFIKRITHERASDPRFSFLKSDDPYHGYYQWYTEEYKAGRSRDSAASQGDKQGTGRGDAQQEAKLPPLEYCFDMPSISAQDLDILKLTALYTARNGRSFEKKLAHRESSNFQFEFLRQSHSLNPLYHEFVKQYSCALKLDRDEELRSKLDEGIQDRYAVLRRAKLRAEQQAQQEDRKRQQEKDDEKERLEFAQIDWHDFKVVETIEFTAEDYVADLPAPLSLAQLQYASLEQKKKGIRLLTEADPDFEPQAAPPPQAQPQAQPQPQPQPSPQEATPRSQEPESRPPSRPGVKVLPKGTTRRDRLRQPSKPVFVSPLTNQPVAEEEYNEHMRISQLDPQYREQKEKERMQNATTNLNVHEAEANLKRLSSSIDGDNSNDSAQRKKRQFGPQR